VRGLKHRALDHINHALYEADAIIDDIRRHHYYQRY